MTGSSKDNNVLLPILHCHIEERIFQNSARSLIDDVLKENKMLSGLIRGALRDLEEVQY